MPKQQFCESCYMPYKGMIARGMNPIKAKFFTFMVRFAPRWKNN